MDPYGGPGTNMAKVTIKPMKFNRYVSAIHLDLARKDLLSGPQIFRSIYLHLSPHPYVHTADTKITRHYQAERRNVQSSEDNPPLATATAVNFLIESERRFLPQLAATASQIVNRVLSMPLEAKHGVCVYIYVYMYIHIYIYTLLHEIAFWNIPY